MLNSDQEAKQEQNWPLYVTISCVVELLVYPNKVTLSTECPYSSGVVSIPKQGNPIHRMSILKWGC